MTIDLSTARAGCEVQFRCGGKAMIKTMRRNEIEFDDGSTVWYRHDGCYRPAGELHIFDIVSITDPPLTEAERLSDIAALTRGINSRGGLGYEVHADLAKILALAEGRAP